MIDRGPAERGPPAAQREFPANGLRGPHVRSPGLTNPQKGSPSNARPGIASASNPEGRRAVAPPGRGGGASRRRVQSCAGVSCVNCPLGGADCLLAASPRPLPGQSGSGGRVSRCPRQKCIVLEVLCPPALPAKWLFPHFPAAL